ncbi:hypothetical protein ACP70R_025581 [Stipagrostis hirtigluma subsp. patula]
MTMTMAATPSSSSKTGLRGPRPRPLKVSSSSRGSSPTTASKPSSKKGPVIVYENTPKVVHARPQEFMIVVQRLTGKAAPSPPAPAPTTSVYAPNFSPAVAAAEEGGDPLLLTLGQRQAAPATVLPSPMAAAGLLMSPGFIFSPNTMQSIQELSPLF